MSQRKFSAPGWMPYSAQRPDPSLRQRLAKPIDHGRPCECALLPRSKSKFVSQAFGPIFPIQNLLNGKSGFLFPPVREGEQTSFDYEERKYV